MVGPPTPPVRLAPMRPGDLGVVEALEPVLFGRDAWSRRTYAEELQIPTRHYVVARDQDELVGYAGIDLATEAQVMTVGVAPGHRRRGIASLMLTDLVDAARRAGAQAVLLEVRAEDEGAQALYRRAGFVPIGTRRNYYRRDRGDALVMRLRCRPGPGPVGREVTGG